MNAKKMLQYLDDHKAAIDALVAQLDEVQVAFNARFDDFKGRHDRRLDHLVDQIADRLDPGQTPAIHADLHAAVEARLPEERARIDERRQEVRDKYLPQRQKAADDLLHRAQAEVATLRKLNPLLDAREERVKAQKAELEAQLAEWNEEIRRKSRGLGVVRHFLAITKADRERQRIIGKLETVNESLHHYRTEWAQKHQEVEAHQAEYQARWQLESVAVARLQTELDQLDDEARREDLALRRAIRHVVDALKEPSPSPDPEIDAGLKEMIELNIQTDDYHEGLASVGGMIGLLRGIKSGLEAIRQSIEGLDNEQRMHSAYLKPLGFDLPGRIEALRKQWPALAQQFADEKTIGAHPADFSAAVKPLLEGTLSEANIEAMFKELGATIQRATAAW
jgi:hypothetical protein